VFDPVEERMIVISEIVAVIHLLEHLAAMADAESAGCLDIGQRSA